MLDSIPQTAWIRLIDYLGFYETCLLRRLNREIRDRIDEDIFHIYKRIEGKQDLNLSRYLKTKFLYPKLDLPKLEVPIHNYINITKLFAMLRYNDLIDVIETKGMFSNILHRAIINGVDIKKLIKAIKLVMLGLSDHYTIKCIVLPNERVDWAVAFKSQDICDIFCFRGAVELSEAQKNNLLRLQRYTFQDCFAFRAAEELTDEQIDIVIEKKNQGMLDYDAIEQAGRRDIFKHNY
jgi:hypothetical protein